MRYAIAVSLLVLCCPILGALAQDGPKFPAPLLKRPTFQFGDGWGNAATDAAAAKRHEEAKAKLLAAQERISREPDSPEARHGLADAYYGMLWLDEAIDAYVAFAKAFPNDGAYMDVCFRIEACLRESRRYDEAEAFLNTLPKTSPKWEIITAVRLSLLHTLYGIKKDVPGALAMLEKVIAKYPEAPDIHFARAQFVNLVLNCTSDPKNNAKAMTQLKWLIDRKVGNPLPNEYEIGLFLKRAQNWNGAIEHYRRVLDQYPDNYPPDESHPSMKMDLATCLEKVGRKDEADDILRSVVRDYPDSHSAEGARSRLGEPVDYHEPDRSYWDWRGVYNGTRMEYTWPLVPMKKAPLPLYLSSASGPIANAKPVLWLTTPDGKEREYPMKNTGDGRYIAYTDILGPGRISVRAVLGLSETAQKIALAPMMVRTPAAERISPRELRRLVSLHRAAVVDIRLHPAEWAKGSILMPEPKFADFWSTLPKDRLIAFCDESQLETHAAALTLKLIEKGYKAVVVYEGFEGLKKDGWALDREAQEESNVPQ